MLLQGLGVLSHFENFYVEPQHLNDWLARLNLKFEKKKLNKMLLQGLGVLSHFKNFYVEPQGLNDWLEPNKI